MKPTPRSLLRSLVFVSVFVAACAGPGASLAPSAPPEASPGATIRPTPTPVGGGPVATPEEAAAAVIASDPQFEGAIKLTPDLIGASRWWVATPLKDGGFRVEITIGSGDCEAGCIDKHTWTYDVSADGQITLVSETDN